jgi:NodT family efflux transporter outer membrane factor (OMF) lipoprotein
MKNVEIKSKKAVKRGCWATAGLVCVLVLQSACAVGPKYSRPTAEIPPGYKELPPGAEKATEGWKTAEPRDQAARGKWWQSFNDPQLEELQEQISISNQNLKAAEAQFRQARAMVRLNRAGYYPTITTGPSVTTTHPSLNRSIRPSVQASTFNDYVLPLDLSYEADIWGRIRHTVEESGANAQASAADLQTIRLSVQAELATNYFTLRGLDAERQLLDSTVAAYAKALELTTNRYNAGVAPRSEVSQAETQLETTRAEVVDLGVARAQIEHAIAVLVGRPASKLSIPPSPITGPPPPIPSGLPSELLERRPDIAAAERTVAAANAGIGIARTAYFPALTLAASAGFESTNISNWLSWPSRFWSVGPSLLQTVFDGGRRRALSEQAQAAYDTAVASYRQSVLNAFQEVEDNLALLRILADEAGVQDAAVRAAQRSLELAINRYKGGVITYLEVIIVQSATLANERTAVDILQRRMIGSVLLIKALGGGWDASELPSLHDLSTSLKTGASKSGS